MRRRIKMKKYWLMCIAAVFITYTLPFPLFAETITLTFTNQNSEIAWGPAHALKPWIEMTEKAAKGKLKIKVYHSQTLSKGKDNWNAVKNGVADMGWCFHGYWP